MSPFCLVYDSPAARVCQHKECKLSPFLCSGPCAKNASEKLHTHNSEQNFISYEEFEKRVERTNQLLDPHDLHREYLQEMRKKIDVTKEYLKKKIDDCLEKLYQQIENDICVEIKLWSTGKEKEMVKKINVDLNNSPLSGKDLSELWKNQYTFEGQGEFEGAVEYMKRAFNEQLKQIEGLSIKNTDEFPNYKKIVEESGKLYCEGKKLFNDRQYKEALVKFKEARQIKNFHSQIHFLIGDCLLKLDQFDEAEESFRRVLFLKPCYYGTCQSIGQIYQRRKNFKEALNWYSKAIELYKQSPLTTFLQNKYASTLSKMCQCLIELRRFSQSITNYLIIQKLQPQNIKYKAKIQEFSKSLSQK